MAELHRARWIVWVLALSCTACGLVDGGGGGGGESGGSPGVEMFEGPPDVDEGEAAGWQLIDAARGGRLDLPDGAWLEVPPGALPRSMQLRGWVQNPPPTAGARSWVLEPEGLEFESPVVFHFGYGDRPDGSDPFITVWHSSPAHGTFDAGSEIIDWVPADATVDTDANEVSVRLEHFSVLHAQIHIDQAAYLVTDIPWPYLSPGDILFALTEVSFVGLTKDGPDWSPGHVGVLEVIEGGAATRSRVIESTPDVVRRIPADNFEYGSSHLYLGARRPSGRIVSRSQRDLMIVFLRQQLGKEYSIFTTGIVDDAFSCVGLAESALDVAGLGVLPPSTEHVVATPLQLFRNTSPVRELTHRAGQPLELDVYGVVVDPDSPLVARSLRGWYTRERNYTLEIVGGAPEGLTLEESARGGKRLVWTPSMTQGCETTDGPCPSGGHPHQIEIELRAYPYGFLTAFTDPVIVRDTLTINVTGHSFLFDEVVTGSAARSFSMTVPDQAIVHGAHVYVEDTGEEILGGVYEPSAGVTVTIDFGPTPGGYGGIVDVDAPVGTSVPLRLRFWVDYSLPHWRNDDDRLTPP